MEKIHIHQKDNLFNKFRASLKNGAFFILIGKKNVFFLKVADFYLIFFEFINLFDGVLQEINQIAHETWH